MTKYCETPGLEFAPLITNVYHREGGGFAAANSMIFVRVVKRFVVVGVISSTVVLPAKDVP